MKELLDSLRNLDSDVKVIQADPTSVLYSAKSFAEIASLPNITPIPAEVLRGISDLGYTRPSKIQESALPLLLKNPAKSATNRLGKAENLIFQSQAGTGKTCAFAVNILSRVDPSQNVPQALVVTPTVLLCKQIVKVLEVMGKHTRCRVAPFFAGDRAERGAPVDPDVRPAGEPETDASGQFFQHVLVCTPGKLASELKRRSPRISPQHIKVVVLDEADHLVKDNFYDDVVQIMRGLSPMTQTVLLSATFDQELLDVSKELVPQPVNIITLPQSEVFLNDNVFQMYAECEDKFQVLERIIRAVQFDKMLIFTESRDDSQQLTIKLGQKQFPVNLVNGSVGKAEQTAILERFRTGKDKILVATNVLARGIDVDDVSLVIHYDLPVMQVFDQQGRSFLTADSATYVHRAGRTGRFGKKGVSICLLQRLLPVFPPNL